MKDEGKIKKSLRSSFLDGCFASAMLGFTEQYIIPFAIALKATKPQIGMLTAFPNLIASLAQLKAADFTERLKSRKRLINIFVFIHACMFIPVILIPFLFKENGALWLILFITLLTSFYTFPAPAWASLMSDHIPAASRGRYFGWRNRFLGAITVGCALMAGFILSVFGKGTYAGFAVIFGLACLSRFASWYFLTRMFEPPMRVSERHYFSFWDFIKRAKNSNFARFVFYVGCVNFSVNIASPFFAIYMLQDLNFKYLTYTLIVTTATTSMLLTMRLWGRHADRVGNLKLIQTTSFLIPALPILWLFSHNVYYLIGIQIIGGFVWAGFNLAAMNFIYDAVIPEKRTRCIAYFNVINGAAICLGALSGGFLSRIIPQLFSYRLMSLFLLSGIMRAACAVIFLPAIREVRRVDKVNNVDLFFSLIGFRPLKVDAEKEI